MASVKVTADILGFILITSATMYIAYKNATYKGPRYVSVCLACSILSVFDSFSVY